MKIQCIDKEIQSLLQSGFYRIPRFQRPYSWEKENIEEFWNDAIRDSSNDYFIGSFVVFKQNDSLYGIVDGQQRLTTITMILCALRNIFKKEGFDQLANGINNFVEKPDVNYNRHYILQTESSFPYFQEHIQKFDLPELHVQLKEEEKNLKDSYELINTKICELINCIKANKSLTLVEQKQTIEDQLKLIRDKLMKLKFIYVELDDEEDAYVVFETLNTRGKDLRPSDLIKNHFTKFLKATNPVDIAKEKWNILKNNIESTPLSINLDDFFHHVWLSKYEFTTLKTLFPKFKKVVNKQNSKDSLQDFIFDSNIYRYIHEPSYKDWNSQNIDIKWSLDALLTFKTTVQTPMILSILREYESSRLNKKYTVDILQAIEHFHFIFTAITSQRTSGAIGSTYSKYSRELYKASIDKKIDVLKELKLKLIEKIPSLEEFKVSFSQIVYTNKITKDKKLIKYILNKIHKYQTHKDGLSINYGLMTIEHIMPQSSDLYNLYGDKLIGQVGNLLLIDQLQNRNLDNKPFPEKRKIFLKTKIYLDDFIINNTDWNKQIIEDRTLYYADLAYKKVFKIN